jgi:hypothetical protein
VNKQLEKMGYNIGTRLIEEFLARSSIGRCADFKEVGEVVAKVSECSLYSYLSLVCCVIDSCFFGLGWVQVVFKYHSYRDA